MPPEFNQMQNLSKHPLLTRSRQAYRKHHYSTPLFVLRETLNAFRLHNGFSISASLSFYAMFALIPMALLIFFTLSHLIVSSDYAIVKLAILTSNLVPQLSNRIMLEVYNATAHQAVWGVFGILALLWVVTPLASALRSAFYTIATMLEAPSFLQGKIKDVLAVAGILLMFFLFTFGGLVQERIIAFLQPLASHVALINTLSSLLLTTFVIAMFYRIFFPVRVVFRHLLLGALVTALLWLAMRPVFGFFISINESYGAVFGSMKNVFISIAWLYYTFAIFLFGTELIAILRRQDTLLLRGLFDTMPRDSTIYLDRLMRRYGKTFAQGNYIYHRGEVSRALYYLVSGQVELHHGNRLSQVLQSGEYFGEIELLTSTARILDAQVTSKQADIVIIDADKIETLLLGEPAVAMRFLRKMAERQQRDYSNSELA